MIAVCGTWSPGSLTCSGSVFGPRRPRQPVAGLDVAGVVVAVGAGRDPLPHGAAGVRDRDRQLAEYAVAREEKLSHVPDGVDLVGAATVAVSGSTALQALHDVGRVQPGQRVIVLGASGGVGSHAVQIARAAGAHVTGVASGAKTDLVRSLGADEVVDYTTSDPFAGGGATTWSSTSAAAARCGRCGGR